jgi:hypothetical protein
MGFDVTRARTLRHHDMRMNGDTKRLDPAALDVAGHSPAACQERTGKNQAMASCSRTSLSRAAHTSAKRPAMTVRRASLGSVLMRTRLAELAGAWTARMGAADELLDDGRTGVDHGVMGLALTGRATGALAGWLPSEGGVPAPEAAVLRMKNARAR